CRCSTISTCPTAGTGRARCTTRRASWAFRSWRGVRCRWGGGGPHWESWGTRRWGGRGRARGGGRGRESSPPVRGGRRVPSRARGGVGQAFAECGRGGGTGTASGQFLGGDALVQGGKRGGFSLPLAEAALRTEFGKNLPMNWGQVGKEKAVEPHGVLLTYRDGF